MLSIARSHVRQAIPGLLALLADGRLEPERVTTTLGSLDAGPELLRQHLLTNDTKTVLVRDLG